MKVLRVSDLLKDYPVALRINENSSDAIYDVLQLQCEGNIEYSADTGFKCNNTFHIDLARKFVQLALTYQCALAITPECSFPFIVLEEIISDKSLWPSLKNLWSFGMEGISVPLFKEKVQKLSSSSNIKVIFDESNITYKRHCNSLWSVFRIDQETLCIVIQLKQRHALDRNIEYEADALSVGEITYVFDLNFNQQTPNVFLSIICADAISLSATELLSSIRQTNPLIINPQLNNQPFADRFKSFRNTVFSDSNIHARMITLNWHKDTMINNRKFIYESGSAFFDYIGANGKNHIEAICKDNELFLQRRINFEKGFMYFADKKYNMWLLDDTCNCVRYFVKKSDIFGTDTSLDCPWEPRSIDLFKFDISQGSFIETKSCFCSDPWKDELIRQGVNPINLVDCINRKCNSKCLWLYYDYFFGICFGTLCKSELELKFETSNRTLYPLSIESQRNTNLKRELFYLLIKCLTDNKFPECFSILNNNFQFEMDPDYAETGSNNIFNLSVKNTNGQDIWRFKKFIAVIIDTSQSSDVKVLYDELKGKTSRNIEDQILVYYKAANDFVLYDEPLIQNRIGIGSASFTRDMPNIMKASI